MKYFATVIFALLLSAAGYGQEADNPAPVAPGSVVKDVKILKKQPGRYTTAARSEGISGSVMLKVEFLASGEIGRITDVPSNHPAMRRYGLVESSIRAAKKIKFKPKTVDGVPVTTTKAIIYSYNVR